MTLDQKITRREELERRAVRHLIRTAKKHGFAVSHVDDGGDVDEIIKPRTEAETMDAVFAVDEATIYFKHPDQPRTHCAQIVLGNSGAEAIADCSMGELWDEVMAESSEYCDTLETE